MPVFNAERFLDEAIRSILQQTESDFELVIVDDASTDSTPSILRKWTKRDPRIRIFTNSHNLGVAATLNRGLHECRSTFIARADADDIQHADRFSRQLAFMEAAPKIGVCGGPVEFIDEQSVRTSDPIPDLALTNATIRIEMLFGCPFWHTAVMFRRDLVMVEGGGYSQSFKGGPEDYDLWERLSPHTQFANIPEVFSKVRLHKRSVTQCWPAEGFWLYSSVSARALSRYLNRNVAIDEADAVGRLCSYPRPIHAESYAHGKRLLRETFKAVRKRENSEAIRYFRERTAERCMSRSIALAYTQGSLSRKLLTDAGRWNPALIRTSRFAKQALRLAIYLTCRQRLGQIRNRTKHHE